MEGDIILYDWLSFTLKRDNPHVIVDLLGLKEIPVVTRSGSILTASLSTTMVGLIWVSGVRCPAKAAGPSRH